MTRSDVFPYVGSSRGVWEASDLLGEVRPGGVASSDPEAARLVVQGKELLDDIQELKDRLERLEQDLKEVRK